MELSPQQIRSVSFTVVKKGYDPEQVDAVVLGANALDGAVPERFREPELLPLGSRIRRRLLLDYASRDELLACLDHLLAAVKFDPAFAAIAKEDPDLVPLRSLKRYGDILAL